MYNEFSFFGVSFSSLLTMSEIDCDYAFWNGLLGN